MSESKAASSATGGASEPKGSLFATLNPTPAPDLDRVDDGDVWVTARLDSLGCYATVHASVAFGSGQTAVAHIDMDADESAALRSMLTLLANEFALRAMSRARRDAAIAYEVQQRSLAIVSNKGGN